MLYNTTFSKFNYGVKHPEVDQMEFHQQSIVVFYQSTDGDLDQNVKHEVDRQLITLLHNFNNALFIQINDMRFEDVKTFDSASPNLLNWISVDAVDDLELALMNGLESTVNSTIPNITLTKLIIV